MSADVDERGDQAADARKQALGAVCAAEIAIGDGDYQTAEAALLQALGQV